MIKRIIYIFIHTFIFIVFENFAQEIDFAETSLPRSEIFPPENGVLPELQGKIIDGRYYSPKNIFSCRANDFGQGKYISQDGLFFENFENAVSVGFYNSKGNFQKVEIILTGMEKKFSNEELKKFFDDFGIDILKTVDNAKDIEILEEEILGGKSLFVAISIKKMSVLKSKDGRYMSSTRGYLAFQENDKLVLLSNQEVTPPGRKHFPRRNINKLKKELLEFRNTFEFGST